MSNLEKGSVIAKQISKDERFDRKIQSRYEEYMRRKNQKPFSQNAYDAGTRAAFAGIELEPTAPRDYKAGYERGKRMISAGQTNPIENKAKHR